MSLINWQNETATKTKKLIMQKRNEILWYSALKWKHTAKSEQIVGGFKINEKQFETFNSKSLKGFKGSLVKCVKLSDAL